MLNPGVGWSSLFVLAVRDGQADYASALDSCIGLGQKQSGVIELGEAIGATFLFTDLVGSTQLSSGMSAAEAEMLRRTHFSLLRSALEAAGGREVKNLGDGLMVVFLSPSRALSCAIGMQQAIDRHNRRSETHLGVRIGVSTGEAVEEDDDFFGDPVIEAARLCARATGGQILTTALVQMTLGRRATQEFVPLGDLDLKGLPEPVPAVEVTWEPNTDEGLGMMAPLPVRLASTAGSGLFGFSGRDIELERLLDAQKQSVTTARLQVVLVSGEPGVGKSSLAAQAARLSHGQGVTVLFGPCPETQSAPYQPWISALSHLVRHLPVEVLAELSPVDAGTLRRLLPADAAVLPEGSPAGSDTDTEQFLLLGSVVHLFELASRDIALLVVVDDLHWADVASLTLLRHLIESATSLRVCIVGTYRDTDLSPSHPLTGFLADLRRESTVSRVSMSGLDDTEVIGLIETASGHSLDDDGVALAHALRRETGGNPFFVGELLRHLGESGAIVQDISGRFSLAGDLEGLALPPSVRDVVSRRVARLGDDPLRVLSIAAVIGQDFDLDTLAEVTDTDPDVLLDILEHATTAAIVMEAPGEPGRFRFTHALIQHTLYQELSATRRMRLHLRVAEALESPDMPASEQSSRLGELARHWQAATTPTNAAKAIDYSRRAGDAARDALALADAARWYGQAIELAERDHSADPAVRCRLLMALASAQLPSDAEQGRATLRRAGALAEEIGDPELMVTWALTRVNSARTAESADPEVLRLMHLAMDSLAEDDPALRARLLAALAEEIDPDDWKERQDLARGARATAIEADDNVAILDVFLMTCFMTSADEVVDEVWQAERAVELAEEAGRPLDLANALQFHSSSSITIGDIATARSASSRLQGLANAMKVPTIQALASQVQATLCMLEGDLLGLEVHADAILTSNIPSAPAMYGGCLFELRMAQGRLGEFAALFSEAANELPSYAGFRPALVMAFLEAGEFEQARSVFAVDASVGFESFPRDQIWLACMTLFVDAAITLKDMAAVQSLYGQLNPFGHLYGAGGPIFYGLTDRAVGNLAAFLDRGEEADRRLRHALHAHRKIGANYWTARTAVDLAAFLLGCDATPDRRSELTSLLDEADRLAQAGGYGGVARQVAALRT